MILEIFITVGELIGFVLMGLVALVFLGVYIWDKISKLFKRKKK